MENIKHSGMSGISEGERRDNGAENNTSRKKWV